MIALGRNRLLNLLGLNLIGLLGLASVSGCKTPQTTAEFAAANTPGFASSATDPLGTSIPGGAGGSFANVPSNVVRASGSSPAGTFADPRFDPMMPRELSKVSMPEYVIEPPDILRIDVIRMSPASPYKLEADDALYIAISFPAQTVPFNEVIPVEAEGIINLGPNFGGPIRVTGMTLEQVREEIERKVRDTGVRDPKIQVSLARSRAMQRISGEHLVRPDGTVGLGNYGGVRLVGMTISQAKAAVEAHLSRYLSSPEVSLEVAAYNSKTYYVIFDGAGRGQLVVRLPVTGSDTVLDAISQVNGLSPVSSKHHIWVARPAPAGCNRDLILPVDWVGITKKAQTATNYQLLPGDRIYVKANLMITVDNYLSMFLSPFERALGVTLLGATTVQTLNGQNVGGTR